MRYFLGGFRLVPKALLAGLIHWVVTQTVILAIAGAEAYSSWPAPFLEVLFRGFLSALQFVLIKPMPHELWFGTANSLCWAGGVLGWTWVRMVREMRRKERQTEELRTDFGFGHY